MIAPVFFLSRESHGFFEKKIEFVHFPSLLFFFCSSNKSLAMRLIGSDSLVRRPQWCEHACVCVTMCACVWVCVWPGSMSAGLCICACESYCKCACVCVCLWESLWCVYLCVSGSVSKWMCKWMRRRDWVSVCVCVCALGSLLCQQASKKKNNKKLFT